MSAPLLSIRGLRTTLATDHGRVTVVDGVEMLDVEPWRRRYLHSVDIGRGCDFLKCLVAVKHLLRIDACVAVRADLCCLRL